MPLTSRPIPHSPFLKACTLPPRALRHVTPAPPRRAISWVRCQAYTRLSSAARPLTACACQRVIAYRVP